MRFKPKSMKCLSFCDVTHFNPKINSPLYVFSGETRKLYVKLDLTLSLATLSMPRLSQLLDLQANPEWNSGWERTVVVSVISVLSDSLCGPFPGC